MLRTGLTGILGIALVAVLIGGPTAGRALAEDAEDGNVSVEITEDATPSPTPVPPGTTPTPPKTPPRSDTVVQETITDPVVADEALGDDPTDLGVLSVSGLTATVSPTFTPENGTVTLTFTVRNTSSTEFDSTTRFWMTNLFGGRIADEKSVQVAGLAAGETRRITTTFAGLGQYTVLHGYVRLTPPKSVEGVELRPLTRDALILHPPLFALVVVGGLAALLGLLWWLLAALGVTAGRLRPVRVAA